MTTREPLLADLMLARTHETPALAKLGSDLRAAHRIVFDASASRTMARIGRDLPDLIAEQMRFAVVPYPVTWIEIDARAHYGEITGIHADDTADERLGWLFYGSKAHSYSQGKDSRTAMGPLAFHLHRPWPIVEQNAFCERTGLDLTLLDGVLWGSSTRNPRVREPTGPLRSALRFAHTVRVIPDAADDVRWNRANLRRFLLSGAGELRMILAALLLLNRPAKPARYTAVPPGRGWIGNKHRPYVGHSVISLNVAPDAPLLPLHHGTGHGSPHRHHEVRPHYAHHWTPRARGCEHRYVRLAEYPPEAESDAGKLCRWECSTCGTVRFRRRAHSRGDAMLGVSVQLHSVTDTRNAGGGAGLERIAP